MTNFNKIKGAIFGQIIGDAIGVPFEMRSREFMKSNPAIGMIGGDDTAHKLPSGRWSDDGALTLALVTSLSKNVNLDINDIADNIVKWYDEGLFTPDGYAFGSGGTTRKAITKYKETHDPYTCGGSDDSNNGNGSLMRILPLLFYLNKREPNYEYRYINVKNVSAITHAHHTSILSCVYLIQFAGIIGDGLNKLYAYNDCRKHFLSEVALHSNRDLPENDLSYIEPFRRLLYDNIYELPEEAINSGFYVVETLEAAIWVIMTTDSFESAVLKAVNLGGDSDSTAAIVGGLAGLIYGYEAIPYKWISHLPNRRYLYQIINKFAKTYEMDYEEWGEDEL